MAELEKTKYVFVILLYRNTSDLEECVVSIRDKVSDFKIIVVNAFYDDDTLNKARKIAHDNGCEFLNIENKGYSYGNNQGISFAKEHYDFEYIIVSNPDIMIKEFDISTLDESFGIVAPQIVAADGKKQNPMVIRENALSERLVYLGLKGDNKLLFSLGILCNKVGRWISQLGFCFIRKDCKRIYAAHGSFLMISKDAVRKLGERFYDENMFLFGEEGVLAIKSKRAGIETCYYPNIKVYHKEDGSMKLGGFSISDELRKANIYYFENYRMK